VGARPITGGDVGNQDDRTEIEELSREECLQLLRYKSFVGRVGFIVDGRPMVLPVNYLAEGESVVFCTSQGTQLSHLGDGARVAFEVDGSRSLERSGWSVVVSGVAREVTDADELVRLERGPLRSWAEPAPARWIRISIDEISGRRIPGH
jgi:nitroimidazol reductase NimA-like FMN-containing flavoprotein (pyridoxamine 5'-phosphate oxidase superfamily)